MNRRSYEMGSRMCHWFRLAVLPLFVLSLQAAGENGLADLTADRAAVERIYFEHRIGHQGTFEQSMPPVLLESLVQADLNKETVLKQVYGVVVTDEMVAAEARRINSTTRAPDVLAEIKAALGNAPARFNRTMARPLVVDRLLRERFENDDSLHVAEREQMGKIRARLLAAKKSGAVTGRLVGLLEEGRSNEVVKSTWLLSPRPVQKDVDGPTQAEVQKQFGPSARILSSPHDPTGQRQLYIEDISADLRQVLLAQLQKAGDISAVIEVQSGFLLYLARERTGTELDLACLAVRKRDFDGWVREQCAKLKQ